MRYLWKRTPWRRSAFSSFSLNRPLQSKLSFINRLIMLIWSKTFIGAHADSQDHNLFVILHILDQALSLSNFKLMRKQSISVFVDANWVRKLLSAMEKLVSRLETRKKFLLIRLLMSLKLKLIIKELSWSKILKSVYLSPLFPQLKLNEEKNLDWYRSLWVSLGRHWEWKYWS